MHKRMERDSHDPSSSSSNSNDIEPLLLEGNGAAPRANWVMNVGAAAVYGVCSIVTTLANKALLTSWGFELVFTLLFLQNLLTVVVVFALKVIPIKRRRSSSDGTLGGGGGGYFGAAIAHELDFALWDQPLAVAMTPVMIMCIANLVCGLSALRLSSVPVYQTLKRMTPLPAMALDYVLRGRRFSAPVCCSVLVVCFGAILTGLGDLEYNQYGYAFAIASCALQALYLVLAARASDSRPLSSLAASYYNALLSLPLLLFGVAYERDSLFAFAHWDKPRFHLMLILDLTLGASLSLLLFMCTLVNSALTTTIVGNAKAVATTIFGAMLFGRVGLETLGWIGVGVNTAGGVLYSIAKFNERARKS